MYLKKTLLKFLVTVIILPLILQPVFVAGQKITVADQQAYIQKYKDIAIKEMHQFHIPASITLAQGMIESNCGKSPLATEANNHFGIKCHTDWTGEKYYYDDDEKQECFRKYASAEESFRDHSQFLATRKRYSVLFSLDSNDYVGWAMGLKQAGYATNPDYPNILIRTIETNQLFIFDGVLPTDQVAMKTGESISPHYDPVQSPSRQNDILNHRNHVLFRACYEFPGSGEFKELKKSPTGRQVYSNNNIPLIFAVEGDDWSSVAKEFGVYSFQIYRDNDLDAKDPLTPGQIIYLEPKKRKSSVESHVVESCETLYSISQKFGIKLKIICKLNGISEEDNPESGTVLILGN